jgi:L-alanine-DL-glutamate epimerase-like enolase superfamily enzyme
VFTLDGERLRVLEEMIISLSHHVVGRDVDATEEVWSAIWRDINFFGQSGISVFGLSAIDMALWDLRGKLAGKSVARLLGLRRTRVPAYASGGLYLSRTVDELGVEAQSLVAQGFGAVKVRVGGASLDDDIARVQTVRDAVGPGVGLMIDANQGLSVDRALRLGRRLEGLNLVWFEEPVSVHDHDGAATIAAALDTPIASGETEYTRNGFRRLIAAKGADILMPDLMRVGGVSEFVKVAHLAECHGLPVSPHLFPEQSLQLLGALSNASYFEHVPWFSALFLERLEMVDGFAIVPDRPGFGFTFDRASVERFRAAG